MANEILINEKNQNNITFENFFESTFANFQKISREEIKMLKNTKPNYISKSGSTYWYIGNCVYRHSNHFLRETASCSWFLENETSKRGGYSKCELSNFIKINRTAEIGKAYNVIYAPKNRKGVATINENCGILQKITNSYYVFDNFRVHKWTLVTLIEN
jgi:hypothetical protein